jgi:16S rRNA (guanine527-N7)-methyltransferase
MPLVRVGGVILALKGASAGHEIEEAQAVLASLGAGTTTIRLYGVGIIDPPTTVVMIQRVR